MQLVLDICSLNEQAQVFVEGVVKLFSCALPWWLSSLALWFSLGSWLIAASRCLDGHLDLVLGLDIGLWCLLPASTFSLFLIFQSLLIGLALSCSPMMACHLGLFKI